MIIYVIKVPRKLTLSGMFEFFIEMWKSPEAEQYVFDFAELTSRIRIEPFVLLFLSSEIKKFREAHNGSEFSGQNFRDCTYAAHMGFYKAFGLNYGKKPGEAPGGDSYVPITIFETERILAEAKEYMVHPGQILESKSMEISRVLSQAEDGDLYDVLSYSIREILRNVIEHSKSKRFGFCAQYWPTREKVELAILDRGIGIREGLSTNPNLKLASDEDALLNALAPGISGKVFKGQKRKQKGDWVNSGYGLFMTSNICKMGGSFFIASGSKGLLINEDREQFLNTPIDGTALILTLKTNRLAPLADMLKKLRDTVSMREGDIKASSASMGLKTKR